MDHRSQLSMDSLFRRRPADSRAASRSASLSRRTAARRRRLVIESLEDRRMLATFSYADQLLTINLDAAASTLTTTAAGSGGYTFSLVGDTFSGSDTFGLVGSGKSTLSVTSALALSQITITNSADAAVRLGAGRYVDDVTVSLSSYSNPPVPSFKVTGNASFGGRDLSVTAPSIVVGANISDAKNIALTSSRSVGIQGTSSVSAEGDLSIRATSQVTQATGSVLSIGGIATVTTGAAAINLIGSGNDFRGTVSLANTGANSVSLTDASALTLGTLSVGGTLTARASGSFVLGTGSVGGNLIVTAGTSTTNGAITQAAGGIAVAGTSSFTTGRNGILLSDTNNDFGGAVSLSYAGDSWDSAITDKNALTLGASTIGGNLLIQSGGLSQTGVLSVGGTTTLLASAASTDIHLSTQANLLTGAVGILRPENVRDFKLRNDSTRAGVIGNLDSAITTNLRDLTIQYGNAGFQIGDLTTAALRNVSLTAGEGLVVAGDITAHGNGTITLSGNSLRTSNWGVQVNVYVTMSTENGNINVTGWGGIGDRETGYNVGVISGGTIAAGGNGNVTITGTGGGVDIDSSGMSKAKYDDYKKSYQNQEGNSGVLNAGTITSGATGTVTVTGFGGVGYAGAHTGVSNAGTITSGGSGAVFVAGTGGSGDSGGNMGLVNGGSDLLGAPAGGIITSGGGNVTVIGNSGIGSSGRNMGVVNNNAQITSGGGTVTVTGTGGPGDAGDNYGVFNASSNITSGGGDVTVNGFGGEGDNQSSGNIGIFSFSSTITSGDAGNVTVTGTGGSGGSGTNIGIYNSVSIITSGGIGTVTVTGNGGSGGNIPENWTRTAIEAIEIVVIVVGTVATAGAGAALSALADVSLDGVLVGADVGAAAVASIPEAVAEPTMQELIDAGKIVDPETGLWTIPLDAADASFEWISEDGLEEEAVVTESQKRATFMFGILEQLGLVDVLAVYKTELSTVTADSFTPALASSTNAMTWNASAWTVSVAEYVEGRTTNSGQGVGEAATKTKGDGFNTGVYIDSSSLIGSGGGDVIIGGKGGAGPTGKGATQSGGRPGYNSGIVSDGIITSGSGGSLTISARAGTNGSGNEAAVFGSGSIVGSTGTLTMTSESGGFITRGLVLADSSTSFNAGSGAIELNNVGNNFSGPVSLTNTGAHNISIVDANSLVLSRVSMSNDGGALTVTTHGEVTQTGAIVTGTGATTINSGDGAITLNNAGNNFRGAVSLANTGANTIAIRDAGALVLSSVSMTPTAAGGLAVTTNGALTQTGAIVTGTGATTINSGNGAVTLTNAGNDFRGAASLTSTGAGVISLTDEYDLTLGSLSVRGNLTARCSGSFVLGTGSVGGNLIVTAGTSTTNGAITQAAGGIAVAGTSSFTTGRNGILLSDANNDFGGAVSLFYSGTAFPAAITDKNALTLGSVTIGQDLTVRSNGALNLGSGSVGRNLVATSFNNNAGSTGAITQTGTLTVSGAAAITAGAAAITLANASNDFRGVVSLANTGANDVSLRDKNALRLGTANVGGGLIANASGAITQTGAIVTGRNASSFNAGAAAITLTNAANDFGGAVSLTTTGANTISIRDAGALMLGNVSMTPTAAGGLVVTTNGGLTQTGAIVTGTGATTINSGNGAVTLTNTLNDFLGAVSLTNTGANNVSLTDKNALTLGALNVGGTLTASASGSFVLGTGSVGGNLIVTAGTSTTNGAITQAAGGIAVAGTSSFTTGRNGILLSDANNDFGGAVSLFYSGTAFPAAITDKNALTLGSVTIGQDLTVRSNGALNLGSGSVGRNLVATSFNSNAGSTGAITQAGKLTVGGTSAITAGAAAITLTNAANNFTGLVSLTNSGSNDVAITDATALAFASLAIGQDLTALSNGALNLGTGTVGRNLVAKSFNNNTGATGAITQAGKLTVGGTAAITAGAAAITLTNAANNFTGAVSLTNSGANDAAIVDATALVLGQSSVGRNLAVTTGAGNVSGTGNLTQTGIVTVAGKTTLTAAAANTTINLATQPNKFGGGVVIAGNKSNVVSYQVVGA